ncbi:MAG: hypothetical protein HQ552_11265 [Desulfobacteraceae bacterium]|nr:hypothetical protein [Desulfobacteraceae bacterium]
MLDPNLNNEAAVRFKPFLDEILNNYKEEIHSIYIIGSALTKDFDPGQSDINSVFVLNRMDLKFLELVAPLGKKYGKKKVAAPLVMTPEYIMNSLDVFPVEFLNMKLLHSTVFGQDLFQDLEIKPSNLRLQCERELKVRLIGLRQGYLSSSGDAKALREMFINLFSGYAPLFRAIIMLMGKQPPLENEEVLTVLEEVSGLNTAVFKTVLKEKKQKVKSSLTVVNAIFKDYYEATEKLGKITDEIKI